jgi:hypothetical protein
MNVSISDEIRNDAAFFAAAIEAKFDDGLAAPKPGAAQLPDPGGPGRRSPM